MFVNAKSILRVVFSSTQSQKTITKVINSDNDDS